MAIPQISFTKNVSIISAHQTCTVNMQVNENFIEFEARATKNGQPYGRGIGTLVASMSIALPNYYLANTNYPFVVTDQNLASGDGVYRISMYAKNVDGVWSDAVAFAWDTITQGWNEGVWL